MRKNKSLNVVWEYVEDPHAEECLRRVLRLILSDPAQISPGSLDEDSRQGLNEDVPVENKQT
jgi:hypothetical protein